MIRRPPRSTRTDTRFPYTTLFRSWGTKLAIDMINERGGVAGYKIQATYADAQSKTDVAINEAERMLTQTGVDMIMGVFSRAHFVPLAMTVDTAKTFFWIHTCISRSDESRVGNECLRKCSTRWSSFHS